VSEARRVYAARYWVSQDKIQINESG
jgi:hypothetical protein